MAVKINKLQWFIGLLLFGLMAHGSAIAQESGANLEIVTKDEVRSIFSMTLDEWNASALNASKSGATIASGRPADGYQLADTTSEGYLRSIAPQFDGNPQKPQAIVVTAGFRGALANTLDERATEDLIAATRARLAPEYSVEATTRRLQGAVNMILTIRES